MFIQAFPDLNPTNFGLPKNLDWQYFYGAAQAVRLLLRRFFLPDGADSNSIELLEDGRIFYAGREIVADGIAGEIALFTSLSKSEPRYEIVDKKVFQKPVEFIDGGKLIALKLVRWIVAALLQRSKFFRSFEARAGERGSAKSVILTYIPRDENISDQNVNWEFTK